MWISYAFSTELALTPKCGCNIDEWVSFASAHALCTGRSRGGGRRSNNYKEKGRRAIACVERE